MHKLACNFLSHEIDSSFCRVICLDQPNESVAVRASVMKSKTKNRIFAISLVASSVLAGCGGGSDSPSTPAVAAPVVTATAEGVYVGDLTGSRSTAFEMLVLENGEFWSLYGTSTASVFGVAGFVQGTGTSANGKFTSSNGKDFGVNPALAGTVSATYDATAKTIAGTVTATTGTVSFSGGPIAGSLYNYNTPASLATVSGAWSTNSLSGEDVALNISSNGAFTATSAYGCKFFGTVTPRPSGKNVFNVGLTFGAAPCALPGQTGSGIALAYPLNNGKTQLLVAVTDGTRTNGTVVFGTRTTTTTQNSTSGTGSSTTVPVSTSTSSSTNTCYVGPDGGTYTITASGNKNYSGCSTTSGITTPTTTTPTTVPVSTGSSTSSKTCFTGPRGGTYTITSSGGKNYGGC